MLESQAAYSAKENTLELPSGYTSSRSLAHSLTTRPMRATTSLYLTFQFPRRMSLINGSGVSSQRYRLVYIASIGDISGAILTVMGDWENEAAESSVRQPYSFSGAWTKCGCQIEQAWNNRTPQSSSEISAIIHQKYNKYTVWHETRVRRFKIIVQVSRKAKPATRDWKGGGGAVAIVARLAKKKMGATRVDQGTLAKRKSG